MEDNFLDVDVCSHIMHGGDTKPFRQNEDGAIILALDEESKQLLRALIEAIKNL